MKQYTQQKKALGIRDRETITSSYSKSEAQHTAKSGQGLGSSGPRLSRLPQTHPLKASLAPANEVLHPQEASCRLDSGSPHWHASYLRSCKGTEASSAAEP